ncbi:trifunctional hydroxymethylpyrimidine kinase/phosphomethylpyrimidine kinase/thiaminase [Malassezia yamatoensis]|uniref:Trifunctional hydroxymethylpyrimidine kinase/phosphomethylpyrimidine kinase/thiaminase n=1 Tax=Malassezia yamatoensis TaxID=253288 RepID=A0AAJ5YS33_9BASI|nr:trifunctional hydroxymethylpyrimidine kinase/phosphomethylpyrimidine kinase/thiaminase [Malassezia yamatoensis]
MVGCPQVLTIAGSDSGGGAGIQADLKTFLALGTYGMSVITAVTAQNTQGVQGVRAQDAAFVKMQFDSVVNDIRVDGIKIGMLANKELVHEIVKCLQDYKQTHTLTRIIVDPVMVSTSGSLLLSDDAIRDVIHDLLPLSDLLTPNLPETRQILHTAGIACEDEQNTLSWMMRAARCIAELNDSNALIKGGHVPIKHQDLKDVLHQAGVTISLNSDAEDTNELCETRGAFQWQTPNIAKYPDDVTGRENAEIEQVLGASLYRSRGIDMFLVRGVNDARVLKRNADRISSDLYTVDVLYESSSQLLTLYVKPTMSTSATHGTGCTLSSAICASQAHGHTLRVSIAYALQYLQQALHSGIEHLGKGPGPLNHGANICMRGVPKGTLHCSTPFAHKLIARSWELWHRYTRHPFIVRMGQGTLSKSAFLWFLRQDYIYLQHYARVWALAAADSTSSKHDLRDYLVVSKAALDETEMHLRVCERAGLSRAEVESTEESHATMAYTRYVMDQARGGLLPLLVSVASCALGYAEVGLWLKEQCDRQDVEIHHLDPIFASWIEEYAGDQYQNAAKSILEVLERAAAILEPNIEQTERLQSVWNNATRLEIGMWDEAIAYGEHVDV